ncbi:hypothetical protein KP509_09G014500 [Ceratopteris richardii]|uniref:Uncharacterized protein n=1 Tax=Ceratopteris richardii TaxID=49495 RepID=A0A8T2U4Q5_CERRI|nr:hypothetical protein KP509_09G014500 [Ceratopteris richardii]
MLLISTTWESSLAMCYKLGINQTHSMENNTVQIQQTYSGVAPLIGTDVVQTVINWLNFVILNDQHPSAQQNMVLVHILVMLLIFTTFESSLAMCYKLMINQTHSMENNTVQIQRYINRATDHQYTETEHNFPKNKVNLRTHICQGAPKIVEKRWDRSKEVGEMKWSNS